MFRPLASAIIGLACLSATTACLGQGLPYNRGLAPHSLQYETVFNNGAIAHQVSAELVMTTDGVNGHDLSFSVTLFVNGAVESGPALAHAVANSNSQSWGCYPAFCSEVCRGGWCANYSNIICVCVNLNQSNNNSGTARFALPTRPLVDGDIVTMRIDAAPPGEPEIYPTDDQQTLVIGHSSCRADFNNDGSVNSQDFFDFITAFFSLAPSADFNGNGAINSQDFFDFVTAFFAGC